MFRRNAKSMKVIFKITKDIEYIVDDYSGFGEIINKASKNKVVARNMPMPVDQSDIWKYVDSLRETYTKLQNAEC